MVQLSISQTNYKQWIGQRFFKQDFIQKKMWLEGDTCLLWMIN